MTHPTSSNSSRTPTICALNTARFSTIKAVTKVFTVYLGNLLNTIPGKNMTATFGRMKLRLKAAEYIACTVEIGDSIAVMTRWM